MQHLPCCWCLGGTNESDLTGNVEQERICLKLLVLMDGREMANLTNSSSFYS